MQSNQEDGSQMANGVLGDLFTFVGDAIPRMRSAKNCLPVQQSPPVISEIKVKLDDISLHHS